MKIKIEKVIEEGVIEISSHIGNIIGMCFFEDVKQGKEYGVEFDIEEAIKLGKNAKKSYNESLFVQNLGQVNELNCIVESIDDDGLCIRLANDCIIVAECDDDKIKAGDYLCVTISIYKIEITIVGIIKA